MEMGAALAAGHADLEGREAAVKEAERRLAAQQVGQGGREGQRSQWVTAGTTRVWTGAGECAAWMWFTSHVGSI